MNPDDHKGEVQPPESQVPEPGKPENRPEMYFFCPFMQTKVGRAEKNTLADPLDKICFLVRRMGRQCRFRTGHSPDLKFLAKFANR